MNYDSTPDPAQAAANRDYYLRRAKAKGPDPERIAAALKRLNKNDPGDVVLSRLAAKEVLDAEKEQVYLKPQAAKDAGRRTYTSKITKGCAGFDHPDFHP
jgi:hypothetical protein